MSIKSELKGTQAGAFRILAIAKEISKEKGIDFLPIQREMMSGNYNNMLKVFYHYFADSVDKKRIGSVI